MKLRSAAVVAGLALGLMSGAAHATTYKFEWDPIPIRPDPTTFSGTFTTNDATGILKSITGEIDGTTIKAGSGIYLPSAMDFINIGFSAGSTGRYSAIGTANTLDGFVFTAGASGIGTLNVSAVPLPSSAPMFGAALLALAGFGYSMTRWVAPKGKKAAAAV